MKLGILGALALAAMPHAVMHDHMVKVLPSKRKAKKRIATDKRYLPTGKNYRLKGRGFDPYDPVWLQAEAKRARKAEKLQHDYNRSVWSNRCHARYFDPSKVELVFSNAAGEEVARVVDWAEPPSAFGVV